MLKKLSNVLAGVLLFIIPVIAQDPAVTQPAADPALNPNAPEFKFEVETYNFGTVKQGESVTYEYKFTNIGKEPLVISRAQGSCGCTVPEWPKEPIAPGKEGKIKVVFSSGGKSGLQHKSVTINSNAKTPVVTLSIKGEVLVPQQEATSPEKKIEGAIPLENTPNNK